MPELSQLILLAGLRSSVSALNLVTMNKTTAIQMLGGSIKSAADACQISSSAVSQWPEELTKDQIDRVQAALYRKQQVEKSLEPAAQA